MQGLKGRCCKRKQADAQRRVWVTINRSFCNDRGKPCAFFDLKILLCLCLEFESRNLRQYLLTAANLERQRCWGRGSTEVQERYKVQMLMAEALGTSLGVEGVWSSRSLLTFPSSSAPCDLPIPYAEGHSTYLSYRNKCLACAILR
jgi:hypothetical protein